MIPVLDAKGAPHIRLPLWSDPAIAAANWPDGGDELASKAAKVVREAFINDGNPAGLIVPPGATIATIKALTAAEMGTADRTAGRRPQLGAVMSVKRSAFVESLETPDAEALDKMSAETLAAVQLDAAASVAAWIDRLDADEAKSLDDWTDWSGRRTIAIVNMGVVCIEHPHPKLRKCTVGAFANCITDAALRSSILAELAYRIKAYSGLGIRPKGLSNSASGSERPSESTVCPTGVASDVPTMSGVAEGPVEVYSSPA